MFWLWAYTMKVVPETEQINFDIYKFIPNLSFPILAVLFGPFGLLDPKDS